MYQKFIRAEAAVHIPHSSIGRSLSTPPQDKLYFRYCSNLTATQELPLMQSIFKYITVTSWWVPWHLKSPASRLLAQPFDQAHIKENLKGPRNWPLGRGIHRWPVDPPLKRPVTRKMFPFDEVIMNIHNVIHVYGSCRWVNYGAISTSEITARS